MGDMIKKIHRRYPDRKWDYKALSLRKNDRDIIYYNLKNGDRDSEGVEVFLGKNYIVGSNKPSHSNRYNLDRIPKPLKNDVEKGRFKRAFKVHIFNPLKGFGSRPYMNVRYASLFR
jgi:hypothetical protein